MRFAPSVVLVALLAAPAGLPAAPGGPAGLEFEPKVGSTGARVVMRGVPKGAAVRFGGRNLSILHEPDGRVSFLVPEGSPSSFIEVLSQGKVVSRSAVPFVVAGPSVVNVPKLIGLKEAIDVFGYADTTPEGADVAREQKQKPILKLDGGDVLTIGEGGAPILVPPVVLGDVASAAMTGMGASAFTITARPPRKKIPNPPPPPPATD